MTPEQRREIARYLAAFDFSGLFTDSALGWDWPSSNAKLSVPFGADFISLTVVAEKRGVKILQCPPDDKGRIPLSEVRRKIKKAVTPLASEHLLIFTNTAKTRQVWQWQARRPGKPSSLRELTWEKDKANELLFQKLSSIAFSLDEEEGLDITGVVQRLTDTLDRDRVTKKFYELFKKQKDAFQKFIKGLSDTGLSAWYTSLMLNRIMFCYFLQRKGFLDGDQNYLANRLARVQDQVGKNEFHFFYRSFLRRLFHEGLGQQEHSKELTELIGNIPYLNGGIFDEHPIERDHPELSIPDEAFEKIFTFFNGFDWHLDDRPIGKDKEINPEILGYVFEKYTNQKEMGAYYTKEDITEYIGKNCIIPFLFHAIADKLPDTAWELLQANPDRYLYEAVRRGARSTVEEWTASLPKNIALGLDTTKPKLIERRKNWNTTTPPSHGLPTEIWRETIARHQRCHDLRAKLLSGKVKSIDDFITLNLDIRQFAQDVIESADASLLLALFAQLKKLSVLDPTCGSGAFLFAALEILEPLYTACIQRFRAILADWQSSGEKHPNWEKEIRTILDHAASHPNEGYYIHKTIIVHNLYGVDIMEEAVEICKLRLFLKLAAQLEQGQQVEPLPDIDFNIRAGNTLVGYATRDEVRRAFTEHQGGGKNSQLLLGGIEHSLDDYRRIEEQAEDAARAFDRFHQLQEDTQAKAADFRKAKLQLHQTLEVMRDQLDRFLASDYDKKHLKNDSALAKWQQSHQPFHWFIEFYGLMNKGGFDVIIGNPPWKEYAAAKKNYTVRGYTTERSGNLYTLCTERCVEMLAPNGLLSFIVQLPIVCSSRMDSIRTFLNQRASFIATITCDDRPGKLFEGLQHCRSTIFLLRRGVEASEPTLWTSGYRRWATAVRSTLFEATVLTSSSSGETRQAQFPKLASPHQVSAFGKVFQSTNLTLESKTTDLATAHFVFYQESAQYWVKATVGLPYYAKNHHIGAPAHGRHLYFDGAAMARTACAVLHSSLFYVYFITYGDCFHVNDFLVTNFRIPTATISDKRMEKLGASLMKSLEANSENKTISTKDGDSIAYAEFRSGESKPIIDEIDTVLAEHYGFTDEELDFILNYDIKYRLGLGRGPSADQDDAS
ncbi:hypothetical protein BH11VER1_BH11VER1_01940 [soil metagenome]